MRWRALVAIGFVASAGVGRAARADTGAVPGTATFGWRPSLLAPVKNDAVGPLPATSQSTHLASDLYGEWQLSRLFAVGFAFRYALDLYSTVNNEALVARIRLGYPVRDWLYPYLVAAVGPGQ